MFNLTKGILAFATFFKQKVCRRLFIALMLIAAVLPIAYAAAPAPQPAPPPAAPPAPGTLPGVPLTHTVSFDSLRLMVQAGYTDQAIPLAVDFLKHDENADVRVLLGHMYYTKNNFAAAKEQFEIVLKNKPAGYADASIGLANVYLAMNDTKSALAVIDEALNKDSSSQELIEKRTQITGKAAGRPTSGKPQAGSYESIRALANAGKTDEAIVAAEASLKQEESGDVRVLLGRMYLRKKNYSAAREQLVTVLQNHPNGYIDASDALADVEVADNHKDHALDVINVALTHDPNSETLLNKKKKLLGEPTVNTTTGHPYAQEFSETGVIVTETVANANGENEIKNFIWIDKEYAYVSDLKQTWEISSISYTRRTPIGSIIGRYNYAYRFNTYGQQVEIDGYPHLFPGAYLYASYGYSKDTSIFPRNRFGLEGFFSLPESFEFSIGIRTLHFTNTDVLYTGSLAKYIGNYWIAYRPYILDGVTNYFTFRRYFSTADSYMSLTLGTGFGENYYSLALPNTISPNKSTSIRLDGQLPISDNLLYTWVVENSLSVFPNGRNRTETDLEMGFIVRF